MVKKIISIVFYLLIVAYISWEVYWYNKVGLTFIKWHTHLAFPFLLFLSLYHIFKWLNVSKKKMNILFLTYLCFQLFETFVLITGIGKTPSEKRLGFYASSYQLSTEQNYYWIDKPNTTKTLSTEEFSFTRQTNTEGYSDENWKIDKKDGEIRILSLGDSFTEGDGAHSDSSYVAFLRRTFNSHNQTISIMNAGKCGSDPFFNYMNYKDRLQKYKPDIIIQTLSTQDLMFDIPEREGLNRFKDNLKLSFQEKNKFSNLLFALSYSSRPFFSLFNSFSKKQKRGDTTKKYVEELFKKYQELADKNNARLIIVFFPLEEEVHEGYQEITSIMKSELEKNYKVIDLRKYYKNMKNCYWKIDGHFNAKGYKIMASGIYAEINGLFE